ncbi:MAG: class I SAM-dependent methyltransferase [Spirochaetia bacterium]|nr:class I SAM-dependent methyltransferase [Spirochaetia bacterium]
MVVERDIVTDYERWFSTPAGMYVDDKERELLINTMRFKYGERVLEIGCGTGRNIEYLGDIGLKACGVEPVEQLVKRALQKSDIKQDQIIRAPYENIPMADNSFENVIFMSSFAFATDKEAALKEAFRIASKKIGIGFLNSASITTMFKVKERRAVYMDAALFSGKSLHELVKKTLPGYGKQYMVKLRYTLYLPIRWGYMVPWVDDMLEKVNLPLGDFGFLVIAKK